MAGVAARGWKAAAKRGRFLRRAHSRSSTADSLLIEDRPRNWGFAEVVNDFRAGGQEPVIARDNARQYITWLNDITLNGGSGRSAGLPTRDSSSMKSGRL